MDCDFREVEQIKCPTFLGRNSRRNKSSYYTLIELFVYLRFIVSQFNLWRVGNKRSHAQFQPYSKSYTLSFLRFFVTVHSVVQVINPTRSDRVIVSSGDKTQQFTANLDKPSDTFFYWLRRTCELSDFLDRMILVDLYGWSNQPVFYFL